VTRLSDIAAPPAVIAAAGRGCNEARAELYQGLAPAAYALIHRLMGARSQAEDVFQDTMLRFFEQLPAYRAEAPIGAWLRRIAVSQCLMVLRSPWHRARLTLESFAEDEWGPVSAASAPEVLDLERALAALPPTARAVVWLYEVEGYSHGEIAASFGRSVSFSKSQLARAHRRLRAALDPETERSACTPT
jgi:RNA polymerase sigma factor (sigma-70 family)